MWDLQQRATYACLLLCQEDDMFHLYFSYQACILLNLNQSIQQDL